tara:strand:+ start:615 stop:1394 length:780 start_codon:yes stop_codon:yes gene_type:complete
MKIVKFLISKTKTFRYLFDSIFYTNTISRGLSKFKDIHKGKTIVVVGNGPSLNKTPLNDFSNCISIGMNKIDLIFNKVNWRPNYVIAENNLVVKQHWNEMKISNIKYILSWKTRWFIPKKYRNRFTFYLNVTSNKFAINAEDGFGSSSTVTYGALQLAYHMGAESVILLGVDHNFKTQGKPLTYELREGPDKNHFDPNYFPSGSFWGVPDLDDSELGYNNAKTAFEKDNRKIYDATVGGKLDIFKKITISEALEIVKNN